MLPRHRVSGIAVSGDDGGQELTQEGPETLIRVRVLRTVNSCIRPTARTAQRGLRPADQP